MYSTSNKVKIKNNSNIHNTQTITITSHKIHNKTSISKTLWGIHRFKLFNKLIKCNSHNNYFKKPWLAFINKGK